VSFSRYERYQQIDAAWLGELPERWHVKPFWALYRRVKRTGFADEELLSVYRDYGVIRKADRDDNFNNPSEDLGGYQLVEPGDLAMNKMKAWQGSLGVSPWRGIVSPAYFVFRSIHKEEDGFLHYLLRSAPFSAAFMTISKGIRINQWDVDPAYLSQLSVPIPPVDEQRAITTFLDRETAKIDALVEEQRRLIELLEEERQAVISRAVTKGLDPYAPMKDSGDGWLGEVPAHWIVAPLKRICSVADCKHITPEFVDDGIPLASIREVQGRFVDLNAARKTTEGYFDQMIEGGRRPMPGDLIFSRNATVGEVAEVASWHPPFAMGQDVCLLRKVMPDASSGFLRAALKSSYVVEQLSNIMVGATFKRVNVEDIRNLLVVVPPSDEQAEIAAHLEAIGAERRALIGQANRAINLLQERRAALISAAVTGKIDVRGWSAMEIRLAVAAEIIRLHSGHPTFGRVKNQKLLYLAEAHAGVHEIGGRYERRAAGPFDPDLISEVERDLVASGMMSVRQPAGRGSMVSYAVSRSWQPDRVRLAAMLGGRLANFQELNAKFADLDTRGAEAVATLYAVWNDALIDGEACDDPRIIRGFLHEWHAEKRVKFREGELHTWLAWMRRNGIVPTGQGPRTGTRGLFG